MRAHSNKTYLVHFFIVLLCMLFSSNANAQNTLTDFIKRLKLEIVSVDKITSEVSMQQYVSSLSKISSNKGKFRYERPGMILLDFENGDYIRMTAEKFTMKNGGRVSSLKSTSTPVIKEMSMLFSACMTGDFEQLTSFFNIDYHANVTDCILELKPLDKKSNRYIKDITIEFNRQDLTINTIHINDNSGDWSEYRFFNKHLINAGD